MSNTPLEASAEILDLSESMFTMEEMLKFKPYFMFKDSFTNEELPEKVREFNKKVEAIIERHKSKL